MIILSWAAWLIVGFIVMNRDDESLRPYPILLGWFILNVALTRGG